MHNTFIAELFDWRPDPLPRSVRVVNKVLRRLPGRLELSRANATGLMTNVEQRMNMFHLLRHVIVADVPGDVVELGCHAGHSAALFRMVLDHHDPARELHVYDSFEGLPSTDQHDGDTPFFEGQFRITDDVIRATFRSAGLEPPQIHPGWFDDTLPSELPERIAFAHLDGDFYRSIRTSLEHVYPRLSPGAICLVDDYVDPSVLAQRDPLPGVKRACDEYLRDRPEEMSVLYAGTSSHAFFQKR